MEQLSGNSVIVIHPGSFYLRIGRASDTFPITIPHCIARKHSSVDFGKCPKESWLLRQENDHVGSKLQMLQGLSCAQEMLLCRPTSTGATRRATSINQLADFNKLSKGEASQVKSNLSWTNTQPSLPFLIGQQALMVNPNDGYFLHWPIRHGCLNLHNGSGGSLSSVLQDLEDIWSMALFSFLKLSHDAFRNLRAVLLIPDLYHRQQVRELTNLLLEKLGFLAAFVVQESVCATFGSGIGSACVVDVGDQKVSVSCVEDGLSLPATRLSMLFGGSDISRCFHWLLDRINFPFKDCVLAKNVDALFVQDLKENFCHLEQDIQGVQDQQVLLCRPSEFVMKYIVRMGDVRILAPMGAFFPDIFGLKGNNLYRKQEKFYSDPSDPNDDDYLIQTMSRHEQAARQRKKDNALDATNISQDSSLPEDVQMDDDDLLDQSYLLNKSRNDEETVPVNDVLELIGIHEAVIMSIDRCDSDEMKKRMFSNIIVVGGGLMFPGAKSWLRHLILMHMPCNIKLSLDNLDINTRPKDMDPRMICWKGGAVMSCLDTSQELWVSQNEWKRHGIRILRERAPFIW